MRKRNQWNLIALLIALMLTACATTTSLSGKNNEAYRTEKPETEAAVTTEEEAEQVVFLTPKKNEVPPFYSKVRVPGIKPILYVYSDEKGDTLFRVFGRTQDAKRGFFAAIVSEDPNGEHYSIKLDGEDLVDISEEKPGSPRRDANKKVPEEQVKPRWKKVPERENLYALRDKGGEYQFRQWATLGTSEGFFPANDGGILIRGGIPDAVKINGKWVEVRIMNPMTFAYTPPESEEAEEEEVLIISPNTEVPTEPPRTERPDTEPARTELPRTEPLHTEPPVTEPPRTEPPVTEPPETEPPVTEPPETEPPVTEPPVTEPPVTEPPVTEPPLTEPPGTETPDTQDTDSAQ